MNLGTQTASLINHVMSTSQNPAIAEGMAATVLFWTDRHAATVTAYDGKIATVQEDSATRTDTNGMSDAQTYEYERNPNGTTYRFKQDKKGNWREVVRNEKGRFVFRGSAGVIFGTRDQYRDFSF